MRIMKDKASLFMDNEIWKWTVTKKKKKMNKEKEIVRIVDRSPV